MIPLPNADVVHRIDIKQFLRAMLYKVVTIDMFYPSVASPAYLILIGTGSAVKSYTYAVSVFIGSLGFQQVPESRYEFFELTTGLKLAT